MNILNLFPGKDTAGQGMAGKRVLEALGHSVRVFVSGQHPFGYSVAEKWDQKAVQEAYEAADVVVVHNDAKIYERVADGSKKRVIVHHHGTRFRGYPGLVWKEGEDIGADLQTVSTVDLLLSVPEGQTAEWFPQVVDVERMQAMRDLHYTPNPRLRISHAPTNRGVKGTRHVIAASRRLRGEADLVLIENQPWSMCLAQKATSDLFIDQLALGYGNNALEAWAMGLPVLCGATESILARMRREYGGVLPFYTTTPDTLVSDIRKFRDPDLRAEWAAIGRAHVERFHAPDAWAERALRLYTGDEPLTSRKRRRYRSAELNTTAREPLSTSAVT